jgi:hypothetical protein
MKDTRWQASLMVCNICNRRWAANHPAVCEYLQCPGCGHMNPAPAAPLLEEPKYDPRLIRDIVLLVLVLAWLIFILINRS